MRGDVINKFIKEQNECKGFFGRWFGHKYTPVYDTNISAPNLYNFTKTKFAGEMGLAALEALKEKKIVYVKHVCQRCGKVVYRD